jgi:hypothetical protein
VQHEATRSKETGQDMGMCNRLQTPATPIGSLVMSRSAVRVRSSALPQSPYLGHREGVSARKGRDKLVAPAGLRKGTCQERVNAPTAPFMVSATSAGSSTSVMRRS